MSRQSVPRHLYEIPRKEDVIDKKTSKGKEVLIWERLKWKLAIGK